MSEADERRHCGMKPSAEWIGCDRPPWHKKAPGFEAHVVQRMGRTYLWQGHGHVPMAVTPQPAPPKAIELPADSCRHDEIETLPADADGNTFGRCRACGDDTFPISGPITEPHDPDFRCGFGDHR